MFDLVAKKEKSPNNTQYYKNLKLKLIKLFIFCPPADRLYFNFSAL